jgi:hypothetical protein
VVGGRDTKHWPDTSIIFVMQVIYVLSLESFIVSETVSAGILGLLE